MPAVVRAHDLVLLLGSDGHRHVVEAPDTALRVPGLGVLGPDTLVGRAWGERIRLGVTEYTITRPLLSDHVRALRRGPQIILPKDASRIVFELGLCAGSRVVEAGAGSGALTLVLAHAVAPTGQVFAYDVRSDHLEGARRNVEHARLRTVTEFLVGDARKGVPQRNVDAFVLDIPDADQAVASAHAALRPGGALAAYAPTIEQATRTVHALRAYGFLDVRLLELMERAWVVHERGARPDFDMLGHTGFLTFARRP